MDDDLTIKLSKAIANVLRESDFPRDKWLILKLHAKICSDGPRPDQSVLLSDISVTED